jgi:HSP20 family molecular chaperone IbpA
MIFRRKFEMSNWVTVRPVNNLPLTRPVWTTSTLNDQLLNEAFNRFFGAPRRLAQTKEGEVTYKLPVNLAQDENNYYIFAQLPGVEADNFEINTVENKLTIAGLVDRSLLAPQLPVVEGQEKPEFKWLRQELGVENLRFQREIEFPAPFEAEKIEASYDKGILQIVVPLAPAAKVRRVPVNNAGAAQN